MIIEIIFAANSFKIVSSLNNICEEGFRLFTLKYEGSENYYTLLNIVALENGENDAIECHICVQFLVHFSLVNRDPCT